MTPRWWTPTTRAIFDGILQDAAFDRLPVFADALEDAGFAAPGYLESFRLCDKFAAMSLLGFIFRERLFKLPIAVHPSIEELARHALSVAYFWPDCPELELT